MTRMQAGMPTKRCAGETYVRPALRPIAFIALLQTAGATLPVTSDSDPMTPYFSNTLSFSGDASERLDVYIDPDQRFKLMRRG